MESETCFNSGRHAHGTGGQRTFTHGRKRVILLSCGSVDTAPAFSSVLRGGRTRTITLTRSAACRIHGGWVVGCVHVHADHRTSMSPSI